MLYPATTARMAAAHMNPKTHAFLWGESLQLGGGRVGEPRHGGRRRGRDPLGGGGGCRKRGHLRNGTLRSRALTEKIFLHCAMDRVAVFCQCFVPT